MRGLRCLPLAHQLTHLEYLVDRERRALGGVLEHHEPLRLSIALDLKDARQIEHRQDLSSEVAQTQHAGGRSRDGAQLTEPEDFLDVSYRQRILLAADADTDMHTI